MSRQPREVYGFGKALPTRRNRIYRPAALVLLVVVAGLLAGALCK